MSNGLFKDPLKELKEIEKGKDWKYEWYSAQNTEEIKTCLYYVEFLTRNNGTTWALFKKNFWCSQEEWEELRNKEGYLFMTREMHPWNLGGGIVESDEAVTLNSRKFLKFLVDSLNKNNEDQG